jgi:ribosomal subunit interface protein
MSFPTIQFKATNIYIESNWRDAVIQKFGTLAKYLGSQKDLTCHVEFEKLSAHQKGEVHRVEATVYADGKVFRAESVEHTFEIAIDAVRKELERELSKAHDRHDTLLKRGRRKIKEMLRFGR